MKNSIERGPSPEDDIQGAAEVESEAHEQKEAKEVLKLAFALVARISGATRRKEEKLASLVLGADKSNPGLSDEVWTLTRGWEQLLPNYGDRTIENDQYIDGEGRPLHKEMIIDMSNGLVRYRDLPKGHIGSSTSSADGERSHRTYKPEILLNVLRNISRREMKVKLEREEEI